MRSLSPISAAALLLTLSIGGCAHHEWKRLYRGAEESVQHEDMARAETLAVQALELAKRKFGPNDQRTRNSQTLVINIQGYQWVSGILSSAPHPSKTMVFQMTWKYGPPSSEWPDSKHIILTFVDYPAHFLGMYSRSLAEYLESLPEKRVPVTFDVTYSSQLSGTGDYQFEKYQIVQIGTLTEWDQQSIYDGPGAEDESSPWTIK